MGSTFHEIIQAIEIHERELAEQAVAIDGTAWLHQFLKVTIANSKQASCRLVLIDKTCQLINHLRGFMYRTHYLLKKRIWPVFVFDGAETRKTRDARQNRAAGRRGAMCVAGAARARGRRRDEGCRLTVV